METNTQKPAPTLLEQIAALMAQASIADLANLQKVAETRMDAEKEGEIKRLVDLIAEKEKEISPLREQLRDLKGGYANSGRNALADKLAREQAAKCKVWVNYSAGVGGKDIYRPLSETLSESQIKAIKAALASRNGVASVVATETSLATEAVVLRVKTGHGNLTAAIMDAAAQEAADKAHAKRLADAEKLAGKGATVAGK